jgi:predicted regulator of Ras-like GTPase activity (Roadblock/LC7/MglB family)
VQALSGPAVAEGEPTVRDVDGLARSLDRFVDRVPGVRSALVVGGDALLVASSAQLNRSNADTAAAISTSLLALATRAAHLLENGGAALTMIEMESGYVFLLNLTDGVLVGHSERPCDVGQVGYELALLGQLIDDRS